VVWCVAFKEIEAYLNSLGYFEASRVDHHIIFRNAAGGLFTIREPEGGLLPELLVNDAFEAAQLAPPEWKVEFGPP
jgi:hypothetical protein